MADSTQYNLQTVGIANNGDFRLAISYLNNSLGYTDFINYNASLLDLATAINLVADDSGIGDPFTCEGSGSYVGDGEVIIIRPSNPTACNKKWGFLVYSNTLVFEDSISSGVNVVQEGDGDTLYEVQEIYHDATGGTFDIETQLGISWDASAATVQSAIEVARPGQTVSVSRSGSFTWTVIWTSGPENQTTLAVDFSNLTKATGVNINLTAVKTGGVNGLQNSLIAGIV